jgi:outer membrane immunogenic protein
MMETSKMTFRGGIVALALPGILILGVVPGHGADLGGGSLKDAPGPVTVWSGFYAGVNGGGGWSQDKLGYVPGFFDGVMPSGAFGGGQVGYNWQGPRSFSPFTGYGSLVLGVEADLQGSDFEKRSVDTLGDSFKAQLDYFGTLRARIGFATDRALFYTTGGFAYGGIRNDANIAGLGNFSVNTTAAGYVLGGGIETMVSPAWSMKLEYQYLNFGSNDLTNPVHGTFSSHGGRVEDDDFHTFRLGFNYLTGRGYEPLK